MKRKNMVITFVVLIVFLSIVSLVIFYTQQSNAKYSLLRSSISSYIKSKEAVDKNIESTKHAFYLTINYLSDYSKDVANLKKALDSIDKSEVIQSDDAVGLVYNNYRNSIKSYVTSNENLVKSIELYQAIWGACGKMGGKLDEIIATPAPLKSTDFVTNSEDCRLSLLAASYAPDVSFNQQYFNAFRFNMESVFAVYKSGFGEGTADRAEFKVRVDTAWNEVLVMNSALLDLTRSPDPTGAIQALQEVVDEQKAGLF